MTVPYLTATPRRTLMSQFLLRGLIAGALVTLAVIATLTRLIESNTVNETVKMVDDHARRLGQMIGGQMHQLLDDATAMRRDPEAALAEMVAQESQDEQLLRVVVVDAQGRIVAAKDRAEVGRILADEPAAQSVFNGAGYNETVSVNGARVLRTATPIPRFLGTANDAVAYAIIIDHSLANLDAQLATVRAVIAGLLALGFVATFGALGIIVYRAGGEIERREREQEKVKQILSAYVSPGVAQKILSDPWLLRLGGERRAIAILFADIRGFTAYAERTSPERVVALLNDYLAAMTEEIFAQGGTVDKFMADGIMALFGAPLDYDDATARALRAALAMQRRFAQIRSHWLGEEKNLGLGIGINAGDVVVGNVGSERKMDYTAIGDAVNLAKRLESIAERGQILLGEGAYYRVNGTARLAELAPRVVKGKSEPCRVFAVA